jgi:hypothetical protein
MPGMRDEITRWTHEGASSELIGERINALPASQEEKSALWLWAWSHRAPYGGGRAGRPVLAD